MLDLQHIYKLFFSYPIQHTQHIFPLYYLEFTTHFFSQLSKRIFESYFEFCKWNLLIFNLLHIPLSFGSSSHLRVRDIWGELLLWLMFSLKISWGFRGFVSMCVVVVGIEKSSKKDRSSSLHNYFSIVVWKPIDKVEVFLIFIQTKVQDIDMIG